MKYRVIDNINKPKYTRGEFLYDQYCIDRNLNKTTFIHSLKSAYYKYDAIPYSSYKKKRAEILKQYFVPVFSNLKDGYDIVDIGAGTGEVHYIIDDLKYNFNHYYFVEPFKSMSDQFDKKEDHTVTIINDYFENLEKKDFLSNKSKVFILSGVLRTMDNIDLFMKSLSKIMNKDDILFLPVEPNNEYFGRYYPFLKPLNLLIKAKEKIKSLIQNRQANISNNKIKTNKKALDQAVDYLKENCIVNESFSRLILYAVIYYNNYHLWRHVNIPDDYNDGFFTIEQLSKDYNFKIDFISTRNYFYGIFESNNKIMQRLFPKSGSTFSAVFRKK